MQCIIVDKIRLWHCPSLNVWIDQLLFVLIDMLFLIDKFNIHWFVFLLRK